MPDIEANKTAAWELELWISNDYDLYHQMLSPIQRNLINKIASGAFHRVLALKAFINLTTEGAKRYNTSFGDGRTLDGFNPATRKAAAESLLDSFMDDAEMGNFDDLLYKKYRK